jgi:hypothetical protein
MGATRTCSTRSAWRLSVNAESDLAAQLAPHLPHPAEAKKTLANLFATPGDIRVQRARIHVALRPAATLRETHAFRELLAVVNRWQLTLPGDAHQRPLRFEVQL